MGGMQRPSHCNHIDFRLKSQHFESIIIYLLQESIAFSEYASASPLDTLKPRASAPHIRLNRQQAAGSFPLPRSIGGDAAKPIAAVVSVLLPHSIGGRYCEAYCGGGSGSPSELHQGSVQDEVLNSVGLSNILSSELRGRSHLRGRVEKLLERRLRTASCLPTQRAFQK